MHRDFFWPGIMTTIQLSLRRTLQLHRPDRAEQDNCMPGTVCITCSINRHWLLLYRLAIALVLVLTATCIAGTVHAQQADSVLLQNDTAALQDVRVAAFATRLRWKDVPASVAVIGRQQLQRFDGTSLVPAMNTVAGVRMEERSPGSYRLSIRGSLLRSPFGVRNVKIYIDDMPLTDATGNTYLNLLDVNHLHAAEIIKGPASSFYGANTGGAVIVQNDTTTSADRHRVRAGITGGSFGMFSEELSWKYSGTSFVSNLQQGHLQQDGYRQQSALRRDAVQWNGRWRLNAAQSLSFLALYSNLHYETPGGITKQQMDSMPTQARQPTAVLPGAVQQNTGIYNRTGLAGVTLHSRIGKAIGNTTTVMANHTGYENPFITNYEKRDEWNYSGRTSFQYRYTGNGIAFTADAGAEAQYGSYGIDVFGNKGGEADTVQYKDEVHATQYFLFAQASLKLGSRLFMQAGISHNNLRYWYQRTTDPAGDYPIIKNAGPTASPRFGVSYVLSPAITVFASAAKGFSPPTLAEVLPSAGNFESELKPEYGWNYEAGIKGAFFANRLELNASLYYFELKDAIVRRNNDAGSEYFVNAGGTIQKGAELWVNYHILRRSTGLVRTLTVWNSLAYQPYRFDQYKSGQNDYSGNPLTGVPRTINVSGLDLKLQGGLFFNATFNFTSSLSLNDANTVKTDPYHLLQCRLGTSFMAGTTAITVFAGGDNLLNEVYSLGNDINAAGNPPRYYNPAPARNFYAGIKLVL